MVGRATTVWDEIAAAKALGPIDTVLVTGPIAVDYPDDIDCWVWFHTDLFAHFAQKRAAKGYSPAKSYWGIRYNGGRSKARVGTGANVQFIDWNEGGSSGLAAIIIAMRKYGAERVMLAGVPMTIDGGQYDTSKPWGEAEKHRHAWTKNISLLQGRVRSFSGWTLQLLDGVAPTAEWLQEPQNAAA